MDPEDWNKRLLEFTNDAIILWRMQGRGILYWNSAAERLYGYERAATLNLKPPTTRSAPVC